MAITGTTTAPPKALMAALHREERTMQKWLEAYDRTKGQLPGQGRLLGDLPLMAIRTTSKINALNTDLCRFNTAHSSVVEALDKFNRHEITKDDLVKQINELVKVLANDDDHNSVAVIGGVAGLGGAIIAGFATENAAMAARTGGVIPILVIGVMGIFDLAHGINLIPQQHKLQGWIDVINYYADLPADARAAELQGLVTYGREVNEQLGAFGKKLRDHLDELMVRRLQGTEYAKNWHGELPELKVPALLTMSENAGNIVLGRGAEGKALPAVWADTYIILKQVRAAREKFVEEHTAFVGALRSVKSKGHEERLRIWLQKHAFQIADPAQFGSVQDPIEIVGHFASTNEDERNAMITKEEKAGHRILRALDYYEELLVEHLERQLAAQPVILERRSLFRHLRPRGDEEE